MTAPDVPVFKLPAAVFDNVSVAVMFALSMSVTTMSVRLSAVFSVYVSAALTFVAVGASFTAVPVIVLLPVTGAATPSLTLVAIVKLLLKFAAGVNVSPASNVFTFARAPLALHTPAV